MLGLATFYLSPLPHTHTGLLMIPAYPGRLGGELRVVVGNTAVCGEVEKAW